MRFFRFDSDVYKWPAWDELEKLVDRRDYHYAKSLFVDFYGLLATAYDLEDPTKPLVVSIPALVKSSKAQTRKVQRCLRLLGDVFRFQLHPVEGRPHQVRVVYPNFLRKQNAKKTVGRSEGR